MRNRLMTAFALIVAVALAACGGESGAELDPDVVEAIDQVDSELGEFTSQLEEVDQEDLQGAWLAVEGELESAVNSLREGDTVDPDDIGQELEEFQQEIESADVEADLRQTWDELRANFEQLMADVS